jgi:hypothetical protein
MRIYIAACFAEQEEVRQKANDLIRLGHDCTSGWRFEKPCGDGSEQEHEEHYRAAALADLEDIRSSDVLCLLAGRVSASGGKHVETGYAMACAKRVVVVGPVENVFHWGLERYPTWDAFLVALEGFGV